MISLLDSGATQCIVGGPGFAKLEKLRIGVYPERISWARAVNGQLMSIRGRVFMRLYWHSHPITVEALVVPEVQQDLILGFNFWKDVGLSLNIPQKIFTFRSNNGVATVPATFLMGNDGSSVSVNCITTKTDNPHHIIEPVPDPLAAPTDLPVSSTEPPDSRRVAEGALPEPTIKKSTAPESYFTRSLYTGSFRLNKFGGCLDRPSPFRLVGS